MAIFLFLRNLRATIIPSVAVPLSLVGTFGVMYLLGFSLNNLTLMALTISTGFVVDDAIVMIENIFRYLEEGETPLERRAQRREANRFHHHLVDRVVDRGADSFALHGRHCRPVVPRVRGHVQRDHSALGRNLAHTYADDVLAIAQSGNPSRNRGRFYEASERVFNRVIEFYGRTLQWVLKRQTATLLVAACHARADDFPLHDRAEGIVSGAGYWSHPRHLPSAANHFLHRDGREAAGFGGCRSEGSGGREFVVIYRHRWNEHDAEQRTHADQSQAAE